MTEELYTCCFCGYKFTSKEMHNASDVVDNGVCCENCNKEIVMHFRCSNFLHAVYRA